MILQFQWEPNNNKCFQGDSQTLILFSAKNVLHQKLFYIETGPKNSKSFQKEKKEFLATICGSPISDKYWVGN